ncbi:hypothetical protein DHEL01_v208459 [Diaporthe helianthi]|uniref:BTB domain-containing protein n=1 Tax=Diaporthe helianthi TaxID=158607 RepID=A0A2P5HSC1_DIAHE|nr:hypothetical protein DHEL01_v208459 [Diaporthe helianthi]
MPSRRSSIKVSSNARLSQTPRTPTNSGRAARHGNQEAQGDVGGEFSEGEEGEQVPETQLSSPARQLPASDPDHYQFVSNFKWEPPVNQHFLISEYLSAEYTDLEIHCAGQTFRAHKIIVCSESPVLKAMCNNLAPGQHLVLNQYRKFILGRVLDFCYHRTYYDGEFPVTVAPFLMSMTLNDVHAALEAPLAVLSDVEDPEWVAGCTECDAPESSEENQDDEYIPYSCNIHCPLDYDSDSSEDGLSSVDIPSRPRSPMEIPQPPYRISLGLNFEMYVAAKQLQIPALQLVARERFTHSFRAHWRRIWDLNTLIRHVYSETDQSDPLRGLICQMVAAGYDSELDMGFKARIRALMVENGEFAAEVLDVVLQMRNIWTDNIDGMNPETDVS